MILYLHTDAAVDYVYYMYNTMIWISDFLCTLWTDYTRLLYPFVFKCKSVISCLSNTFKALALSPSMNKINQIFTAFSPKYKKRELTDCIIVSCWSTRAEFVVS